MARLGVNVDHVATVRQARGGAQPDPVIAAALAELAGADGITVHLREDRRHIQDRDVELLRETVKTRLNLEMAATEEMVRTALRIRPDMVTLVPEKRLELTTEGGLDVQQHANGLKRPIEQLKEADIAVSLFVDPDLDQLKATHRLGVVLVELHTGIYCEAVRRGGGRAELEQIAHAISAGRKLGIGMLAGHGLDYQNIRDVVSLGGIVEFNIGHSIVSRAMLVGMERAVKEMAELVRGG